MVDSPHCTMHAPHSTCSTQRQSQRVHRQIAIHVNNDFYDCPQCQKLFTRYHGAHKRHIKSCEAKYAAQVEEEARSLAEQIRTPTPDPYTPIPTDIEVDSEDTSQASVSVFTVTMTGIHAYFSVT